MKRTCKATAAGVVDVISGCFGVFCAISLVIPIVILEVLVEASHAEQILIAIAIMCAITGVLAIIGGAFALKRKLWALALAGSIASIFPCFPLGIAAVILTALSRDEFS